MMGLRDNWRIYVLVLLTVLAGVALFLPGGDEPAGDGNETVESDLTNLRFGLDLEGGTRLRAAMVGLTAEDVPMTQDETSQIDDTVWRELGLDPIDVEVRQVDQETGTVEVHDGNVTREQFRDALAEAGVEVSLDQIREGVTADTRETTVNTLNDRINQAGLSGGSATVVSAPTGENFAVVEVPGANRTEVLDLIGEPGRVQLVATYPVQGENGTEYREEPLLEQGDFSSIQTPAETASLGPHVPVSLTPDAGERFQAAMNEYGFTTTGVEACRYRTNPDDPGYCLYTVVDDEVVHASSMGEDLAGSLQSSAFMDGGREFVVQTDNMSTAHDLHLHLRAGALPTDLDIQSATFLSPSLAEEFKYLALLTGILTWVLVSIVVYWRYREVKVAVPMLATASSEVFLLLGFAAAIGLSLDLAHIAGLIAVIGTGVDDLIIIADEILQRGTVATDRVFRSRFRKAFWVIGAAAATTIIAMSPLAMLSLGDLQGFAIVTIVGVLIGVLVTRPAYGDVLRHLLLEDEGAASD